MEHEQRGRGLQCSAPPPAGKAGSLVSLNENHRFSQPEKHLGSKYMPLLNFEPSKYILGELHILLRIADVLMRNLIHAADHLDQKKQLRQGTTGNHMSTLQELIRSCGVAFTISQVKNNFHKQNMFVYMFTYTHTYLGPRWRVSATGA